MIVRKNLSLNDINDYIMGMDRVLCQKTGELKSRRIPKNTYDFKKHYKDSITRILGSEKITNKIDKV